MDERPIVEQLFKNRYWFWVEQRAFQSVESLEFFGYIGEPTEEKALEALSTLREVSLPIPVIAEFLSDGYKMRMSNIKDAAEIFRIVNAHLYNWTMICRTHGYVYPMPPFSDFQKLDKLAELLFPYRGTKSLVKMLDGFNVNQEDTNLIDNTGTYHSYLDELYGYCKQAEEVAGVQ